MTRAARALLTRLYKTASALHRRARRGPVTLTPTQAERIAKLLAGAAKTIERTQ